MTSICHNCIGRSRSQRRNSSRLFFSTTEFDQVVALEAAIDARPSGERIDALATELVQDAAGTPARVKPADLADQRFELGWDLMAAAVWSVGLIGQGQDTAGLVAGDPAMDGLARDA
jgi:hypothetical protein